VVNPREQILGELAALVARCRQQAPELLPGLGAELQRLLAELPEAAATPLAAEPAIPERHGMVGHSPVMLELLRLIERFGPTEAPVLITGESGTGKEKVAQALHACSRRKGRSLVAENCAAIPESLMESVLFGHKRGAFTGAFADHPGHFVSADGGTLFLDEIGELRLPMQSKLLRVLQEGEVRAVGDRKVRKVDVRVLAATNQSLEAAVAAGKFREDLYFRLNVLRLELPPLRDRGDDILLLARRFLADAGAQSGRAFSLSPAAAACLLRARWPGNVRQLQNEMQRAAALSDGDLLDVADLSPELRA
jgi:two-component system response regulator HydG